VTVLSKGEVMSRDKLIVSALAVAIALAMMVPAVIAGEEEEFRETFNAFAVNMGTIHTGATTTLQINITRWSTDEERQKLFTTLVEKGQKDLINALHDMEETGWVRLDHRPDMAGMHPHRSSFRRTAMPTHKTFPSERLRYAREFEVEDKRRIVLALDRPIPYWEAIGQPRTIDYPLTLIVLDVDDKGDGEGKLAVGVKLSFDEENKRLEIENFGSEPVRLTSVHK
jgi:hypothetical protein